MNDEQNHRRLRSFTLVEHHHATYSKKDLARVATAIGKKVAEVEQYEKTFEAASLWYRLDSKAPTGKLVTPFRMRGRMFRIASAADRLLRQLGVCDAADAPDGLAIGILEVLASTGDDTEDTVIRATARVDDW
jgi:histidinol phosphatase-like PHP family hydrolase